MQEIKFRIWNGKLFYYLSNSTFFKRIFLFSKLLFFKEKYFFQQFTSLIDRNDKEIYDGDIILDTISTGKYQVYWNTDVAGWDFRFINIDKKDLSSLRDSYKEDKDNFLNNELKNITRAWSLHLSDIPTDCEVIGNIFEKEK